MCTMKRLMAVALYGVMGCVAMAQAIPDKIYVNRYSSEKRVEVVGGAYVDSMRIKLGNVKLYDSLYFHMTDGTARGFRVRGIDSITIDEPHDLLLKELDYFNKISNKRIPTYADSYVNIASWSQRSQWNLANVHDPTVVKAADGYYYMYQTDASYGNSHVGHGHFHGRRSRDLVNWEYLGATLLDDQPQWALDSVNAYFSRMGRAQVTKLTDMGYWAPVVRKINNDLYRMYYCLVPSEWAFIGMMETTDPASNKWEDKGFVISSSSDKSASAYGTGSQWGGWFCFNAIDPTYEVTPDGKHWLIYGSWHTGIAAVEINPETGNVDAVGITEQTEQVMKNLGAVLTEAGSSFEKAIKTTCFLADISDFAAFNEVYAKHFTEKPARSCVAVKDLPKGVLVEVEVIAAI